MSVFMKSMSNKILINSNKIQKYKIKHGYPITITSGTLVPNYSYKSKANQCNTVVGTSDGGQNQLIIQAFRQFWFRPSFTHEVFLVKLAKLENCLNLGEMPKPG